MTPEIQQQALSTQQEAGTGELPLSMDLLSTGVLLLDANWQILEINMAAETLLEVSASRACKTRFTDLLANADEWKTTLQQALGENLPLVQRNMALTLRNGTDHALDATLSPLLHASNRRLLVELTAVDRLNAITAGEDLWQSQLTMRTVVRGLAHEIKNPLGGIRGAAQLLSQELPDPELREYTDVIMAEADRLRALVDRLLGPREQLNARLMNIHEVLHRVQKLLRVEAGDGLTLRFDYDPSLPEFLADPDQITQALLNIVRNAWQAIGSAGTIVLRTRVRRKFTIGRRQHRLLCAVEVIDDGPGVPDDMINQLFLPAVSGRSNGSGLGLSIAQMIANRHGGLIQCTSAPGNTCFTLLLPMEADANDRGQ